MFAYLYLPREWSETGGDFIFTFVCVCAHLARLVWMVRMTYCVWLVREKLRIFPYGQYIVGNVVLLPFWRCSQVEDQNGGRGEMYKNITPFPMDFPHTAQHAVRGAMTSLSLAGVYCARTLLGRRICKRVDVYVITLSCTWLIYALSERLLVYYE